MNNKKRQLVIIGLDGGTFKIIDPLIAQGKLPNIESLTKSGVKAVLKSTYPPITAAAWVSFMTGKNPGKHGFYDFREYDPTEYTMSKIPMEKDAVSDKVSNLHSSRFHGNTIWDFLSEAGYEVNVVTVPVTYPPWKVNGRMVSGYPSPDYDKPKTFPPEWSDEIGKIFNMSAIDYSRIDGFVQECKELVKRKGKIILDQIKNQRGDVFAVVFSSSDFAQHYFWKYLEEQNGPYSSVIFDIYQEIDKVIGEITDLVDNDASIVIMSDHGFMEHPQKYFNVNSWLVQQQYMKLKENKKSSINIFSSLLDTFLEQIKHKNANLRLLLREKISNMPLFIRKWASRKYYQSDLIDWSITRAFRFKMYGTVEGIVINKRGCQKKGIVENVDEYEQLRNEIIEKLLQEKDPVSGKQVVIEAFRREDLYSGEFIEKAPDIILQLDADYSGGLNLDGPVITPVEKEIMETLSGIHDHNGICILKGPNIQSGMEIGDINIIDIVPSLLYDLNLLIPDDIDGKVAAEAFLDSFKSNLPRYCGAKNDGIDKKEILSGEDEEEMKKALRSLGYLE